MNDTPTPETDTAWDGYTTPPYPLCSQDLAELCRKLERERDEAREETIRTREFMGRGFARAKEELATMGTRHAATMMHTQSVVEDANQLREQRDRLAEAVNAATVLIAAKGRHNTMLAYEGLRSALSPKNARAMPPAKD